jgi:hypothetical protein
VTLALLLYLFFSFLAAGGLAWILYEQVGPKAAWWGGLGTLSAFALLAWFVAIVIRAAGG